jgi:zinc transport system permease protein
MDGASFFSDLLAFPFLRYAAAAGVLSSVACGVVGSYVTVKRIGYIAGAIAHSVLAGMGAARYLRVVAGWTFLTPEHGATVAAVIAALIVGVVSLRGRGRVDTVLGAIWSIGMAAGILFIQATPGYSQELMSYLFGNILLVSPQDLAAIAALDLVVVAVGLLFYNNLVAIAFDEEFARLRGVKTERTYLLLLVLTALTIVTLAQVVGILMVIALLTLPAATASGLTRRLWQMVALSIILSILYTTGGLALSYGPNLPAGATIILFAGGIYLLVVGAQALLRRIRRARG